jgi:Domain of unknown function (DUF1731)
MRGRTERYVSASVRNKAEHRTMIHFEEITLIDGPIERVFDLSRSVEVHLLANIHCNEQALATGGVTTGLVSLGQQVTGAQYVSWIHEADFVRAIDFLIANDTMTGAVNICSPNPLRNREFMRALRASWRQSVALPAPAWMIEIGSFFLRTESELVLKSRWVVPGRLMDAGFTFTYPEWPTAAQELVSRYRRITSS